MQPTRLSYRQKLIDQKRQQAGVGFQQFLHAEYQKLRQQGDIVVNPRVRFLSADAGEYPGKST